MTTDNTSLRVAEQACKLWQNKAAKLWVEAQGVQDGGFCDVDGFSYETIEEAVAAKGGEARRAEKRAREWDLRAAVMHKELRKMDP